MNSWQIALLVVVIVGGIGYESHLERKRRRRRNGNCKTKSSGFDEITEKENKRFVVEVIEKMKQEPREFSCFVYEGQTLAHYKTGVGDFAKEVKMNRLERNRFLASLEKVRQSDATRLVMIGKRENGCFAGKPTVVWCK